MIKHWSQTSDRSTSFSRCRPFQQLLRGRHSAAAPSAPSTPQCPAPLPGPPQHAKQGGTPTRTAAQTEAPGSESKNPAAIAENINLPYSLIICCANPARAPASAEEVHLAAACQLCRTQLSLEPAPTVWKAWSGHCRRLSETGAVATP